MIKRSIIWLLALPLVFHTSIAQITLLESDMSSVGDVVVRYNDTIPVYGPGGSGPGQTWDFTQAIADDTANTFILAPSSTPFSSTFSSSNLAMQGATESYLYFTQTMNQLITDGAAGDLLETGEMIESPFSDPLVLHNFPRTYGDFSDDTYAFQTEASGAGFPIPVYRVRLTHNGHAFDTTDAYGTLITPTGSYDALRVKTTDYTTDVLEYKLFQFSSWALYQTIIDTVVSYSWHGKLEKLALAEFAYDSLGNPKRFTYSAVPPAVNVNVHNSYDQPKTTIYPMPANDKVCIDESSGNILRYEVLDTRGIIVRKGSFNAQCIPVNDLNSGLFFIRIWKGLDKVETFKFLIAR